MPDVARAAGHRPDRVHGSGPRPRVAGTPVCRTGLQVVTDEGGLGGHCAIGCGTRTEGGVRVESAGLLEVVDGHADVPEPLSQQADVVDEEVAGPRGDVHRREPGQVAVQRGQPVVVHRGPAGVGRGRRLQEPADRKSVV